MQRRQHGLALRLVELANAWQVLIHEPRCSQHLSRQTLIQARAVQVGGLLGLQQPGEHRLRRHHEAQPQPGRQHLGQGSDVEAILWKVTAHWQGWRMVEPEFAIRVVFNDRQFQGVTGSGQLLAHLGRQGLASGILEIGQQVQKARGVVQLLTLQNVQLHLAAVRVVGNAAYRGAINRKRLQRTQIGRRLYGDAAAFVDKHLAHKVERLLRTRGDQHLIR